MAKLVVVNPRFSSGMVRDYLRNAPKFLAMYYSSLSRLEIVREEGKWEARNTEHRGKEILDAGS